MPAGDRPRPGGCRGEIVELGLAGPEHLTDEPADRHRQRLVNRARQATGVEEHEIVGGAISAEQREVPGPCADELPAGPEQRACRRGELVVLEDGPGAVEERCDLGLPLPSPVERGAQGLVGLLDLPGPPLDAQFQVVAGKTKLLLHPLALGNLRQERAERRRVEDGEDEEDEQRRVEECHHRVGDRGQGWDEEHHRRLGQEDRADRDPQVFQRGEWSTRQESPLASWLLLGFCIRCWHSSFLQARAP